MYKRDVLMRDGWRVAAWPRGLVGGRRMDQEWEEKWTREGREDMMIYCSERRICL